MESLYSWRPVMMPLFASLPLIYDNQRTMPSPFNASSQGFLDT
jgi:hypothetical protein